MLGSEGAAAKLGCVYFKSTDLRNMLNGQEGATRQRSGHVVFPEEESRGQCAWGVGRGGLKGRQWSDGAGTCHASASAYIIYSSCNVFPLIIHLMNVYSSFKAAVDWMFVCPPKGHMLKCNPQCVGIRRWGL